VGTRLDAQLNEREDTMADAYANLTSGSYTIMAQERVVFGKPAGDAVVAEADRSGAKRVFVLSTRSLSQLENGPLQRVVKALGQRHVGTFTAIRAHSPREDICAGANQAREARADLLVAVGGGSVIDAAKAMQLCLWQDLKTADDLEPYRPGGEAMAKLNPTQDAIRMIAVPTTLSAAEFTSFSGVTDSRTHTKQLYQHRLFAPRIVVLDPGATMDTPDWLLYCTGIRAVDHAVESYCALTANPATEALSLQGLRLLARALPAIKRNPKDLAPRLEAQFGMWQSITPLASGVPTGASHGIGYVLGGTYGVAHGHTSCVMLPAVLRWNAQENAHRQRALSEAMGEPNRPAFELIAELIAAVDQPGNLRAVGIKRDAFDDIATRALGYDPVRLNPRKVSSAEDVKEILEIAW
jgi:maleylacetate reductase